MKGKIWTASLLIAIAIEVVIMSHGLTAQQPDPSPRVIYLGTERLPDEGGTTAPARVHFYLDRVTHNEVACFSQPINQDAMSCVLTGRQR